MYKRGFRVDDPKYKLISGRFTEGEDEAFRSIAAERAISLSEMVRTAMLEWKARQETAQ